MTDPRTPEQIAAGWLLHDGGPCPVALDSKPQVLIANRDIWKGGLASQWIGHGFDFWKHDCAKNYRILAYLPDPEHPETLKARIAALEAQLAEAKAEIERLRGNRPVVRVLAPPIFIEDDDDS